MNRSVWRNIATAAVLASLSWAARAHGGSDGGAHHGLLDGLRHPFTGADHLAAMLAVGVWSAMSMQRLRDRLAAPLAFAAVLLVGSLLARAGAVLPAVEPMIAASLLAVGLLVATRATLPAAAGAALAGGFALFHGAAHGQELAGAPALAGMVLATAALHAAGLAIGLALRPRGAWLSRAAGAGVALYGAALLAA